jgi:hypothetical protein
MPTVEISEEILSKLLNGIIRLDAIEQSLNIKPTSASSVTANNTNAMDILITPTPSYPIFNSITSSPTSSTANHFHSVASMAPVSIMDVSPVFDPKTADLGASSGTIRLKTKEERLAALPPYANPKKFDMYARCVEYSGRMSCTDRVAIAHKYGCTISAIDSVFAPSSAIPREAMFYTYLEAVRRYETGSTRDELLGMEWPRLVSFGKGPNIPHKTIDEIIAPDMILRIKDTAMQMWACEYHKNNPIPTQTL